ncbi:SIS domain-containing protein [Lactococcus lactis]|nr:SIS domain-containing protein [Lactococcus lactis subsp. lactis]MCT3119967.1 SIS domain-containing protein [Lactococcus lactis]
MNLLQEAYKNELKIYVCGNGGSASTASHLMNAFNKDLSYDQEKKWHVISLINNVATVMAITNDNSYNKVFSKQLEGNMVISQKMIFF